MTMGLFSWLRRSKPQEIERAGTVVQYDTLYGGGYPNAERCGYEYREFAELGYKGNAVVFACAEKRRALFSEVTVKYRALGDKHLFGDQSLAKFETPWPDGSIGDLFSRMIQDVDMAGNAYIRDAGDQLERLRPDWVTIVSEIQADASGRQVRRVVGFIYDPVGDPDREMEWLPVEEVAHWTPIPDPLFEFRGMSWITPVLREVNADIQMSEFRDNYFKNAATPNLVIKYTSEIQPEKLRAMRDVISARHTGSDNAFKTMILDSGADMMVVGSNMEGSGYQVLEEIVEARIAAAAGVPLLVVGLGQLQERAQPGSLETATRNFVDMTMRPLWRSACAALSKLSNVPAGAQLWYDTSDVTALQPGEQSVAAVASQNAGTINTLIMAGFTPESCVAAIISGDLGQLQHTGLVSVQMQELQAQELPAPPAIEGAPANGN